MNAYLTEEYEKRVLTEYDLGDHYKTVVSFDNWSPRFSSIFLQNGFSPAISIENPYTVFKPFTGETAWLIDSASSIDPAKESQKQIEYYLPIEDDKVHRTYPESAYTASFLIGGNFQIVNLACSLERVILPTEPYYKQLEDSIIHWMLSH